MSFALAAGVSGLQAHQKMLDVAGNNLANINTTGFKAGRILFSELLAETIKKASQPTGTIGGSNPQQMGSGVGVAIISPNMAQGNISSTGNPLDLALEGAGYFVISDGSQNYYTRAGTFAIDADSNLVDPSTGYIVQRTGTIGEDGGFQTSGVNNIKVPDVAIAAKATTSINVTGNLSAESTLATPNTNVMTSALAFTTASGTTADLTTKIADLDQYSGTLASGVLTFTGLKPDGTALGASPATDLTMPVDATTTLGDVITWLNDNEGTAVNEVQTVTLTGTGLGGSYDLTFGGDTATINFADGQAAIQTALEGLASIGAGNVSVTGSGSSVAITFQGALADTNAALMTIDTTNLTGTSPAGSVAETTKGGRDGILGTDATASLFNGKIIIKDTVSGYSQTDLAMSYAGDGTLTLPSYFEATTVGGTEVKNASITVYDSQGGTHVLSAAFVRTDTAETWDMLLTSITGDVDGLTFANRRIKDIEFNSSDGSLSGLNVATGDTAQFTVTFGHDTANPQQITVDMGTSGKFDGLTQFKDSSTAVAKDQDGYKSGSLTGVSISNAGILIGSFSNGIKRELAALQIGIFQNPSGLESAGNGYYRPSVNSGDPVATQATVGGAGVIHGGSLEKSNADVASLFVNMIEAQNGYHANARTIRVANDMLKELTNLIR